MGFTERQLTEMTGRIKLISFADKKFYGNQRLLNLSARKNGIKYISSYSDKWLRNQSVFWIENNLILNQKKGCGYWIWKPFIILDALNKMRENDKLIYLDSGTLIIKSILPLINELSDNNVVLFRNGSHINSSWTKRDCFVLMNCDSDRYYNASQVLAGYILCKKNETTIKFIQEWLNYCLNYNIVSDSENITAHENNEGFKAHRHDQSILSILAEKHSIKLYNDPSEWGCKSNFFNDSSYDINNDFSFQENHYLNTNRKQIELNIFLEIQYLFSVRIKCALIKILKGVRLKISGN